MTILERNQVRAAVERAVQLDPHQDLDAAIACAAAALCLPEEAVRDAVLAEVPA